ncbi:MAG: methylmalonyl-CoA mutase family protein, partial [Flavobacteriaceae bacterium]|nr:methylmalonyl-CoA mutase family protein [Flavobacteriaceae bacterium]
IFDNLHIQLGTGSEYFIEIGKIRAFNHLLHEVAAKYGVDQFNHTLTTKTSVWNKSVTDAHTNMLRATTEAMSAILGNADGILIDAYDSEFNEANEFSSRIAGNIATILKEESYFGKVRNPVDGAYYIEEISYEIAEKALALFKNIEENGGFCENIDNEEIQNHIALIRFTKIKLLSQRKLAMVGVNKYPNLMETIDKDLLSDENFNSLSGHKVLKPRRASLELESLRRKTEVFTEANNFRPIVELSSFGNLNMRKARAAFAYDFMGVSGYKILPERSFNSALEAAEESSKSDSNVVVICSSDKDYEASALEYVKLFRSNNTDKVLLLAGNPENISEALIKAGLDGFIHLKSDVIQTISGVQNKIQKTIKHSEL